MISRLCRASLTPGLVACALLTAACQKVPLLAPSGSTITLTASATALPANGTTDIIAQLIEASGTPPHSGTHISFTTNLGSVQPSEAETDISGRVTVKFVAGTGSGTATITAISGGVSASGANAIKIAIGAAAVGKVTADANPTTIPATGGTSLITATAFDVNGNLIGGVPITFSTDAGAMSPASANTDANGRAQSTLATTKAATVTVSAGLATTTGGTTPTTTAAQTATVKVNVNVSPGVTIGAPSPATPTVGQSVTFPLTYTTDANASPIVSTTVDFGDNTGLTVSPGKPGSVSHTYNSGGSFSVRATVLDSLGDTSTSSTSVLVGAKPQPVVSIAATTPNPTAGSDVTFTASVAPAAGSGTNIASVTVNFGEPDNPLSNIVDLGAVSGTAIALHHVYLKAGTYTVTLTAKDTNGGVGPAVTTIFVQAAAPLGVTVTFSQTSVNTTNTLATFTATVTGLGNTVATSYDWVFGDGQTQTTTTNQVTHNYTRPATPPTLVGSVTVHTSSGAQATGTFSITP